MKWYPKGLEGFLGGDIAIDTDTLKCALLSSTYTQSDSHQYLSDLSGTLGTSAALASKTITSGVFDCADFNVTIGTSGTVTQAVVYQDTGVAGTSRLIAFIDKQSDGTTAISKVVTSGDTVAVTVHASGIGTL